MRKGSWTGTYLRQDNDVTWNIDEARWNRVVDSVKQLCESDAVPAAALCVGSSREVLPAVQFGRQFVRDDSPPLRDDAVFLVASITKPMVASAALLLVERGELALGDRVHEYIPEFAGSGRYPVAVRHLLTHTSGLPDMLEDNESLRAANSPLAAFVAGTCDVVPDFTPGSGVRYQSMGFAMLGEIVARITGLPCAEFLRREFFEPLQMNDTSLGAPPSWFDGDEPVVDRIAEIRLPARQSAESNWHWNSRYWRSLGAPWGGLLTTPGDLSRFARMMLNGGELDGVRVLGPATVRAATRNQLETMRDVPEVDRRCRGWGLGWRLNWPDHSANFGDLLGPRTFGHWGATGTVLWMDPDRDLFAVVLTTQPQEPHGRVLSRVSNMIAAAVVEQ